jgi:hypothetical protein
VITKKEMLEEEEVDKLILNSLCSEIMDEVMDLYNAYPTDCDTAPRKEIILILIKSYKEIKGE